jgi:transmembrane sensor
MAPQSRLQFVQTNGGERVVSVDGEAYFDVAQSQRTPFLVRSGAVTTRVLGTAFLVRYDAGETHVRVSVAEGKVRVTSQSSSKSGVTLSAGQVGELTDSTIHVISVGDLSPRTEWLRGRLFFHETPVSVVLETLHRWYGYQFQCADTTLAQRPVDIIVSAQSSTDALASLQLVLNVNVAVIGDTVRLTPQTLRPRKGMPRIRTYDVWTPAREIGR